MRFFALAAIAGTALLGACSNEPKYEFAEGACYFVATPDNAPPRLQKIADDQPQLEQCAARLEEMRLRFLRMGGSNQEIAGAYQGRFIFVDREGVKIGKSLTGSTSSPWPAPATVVWPYPAPSSATRRVVPSPSPRTPPSRACAQRTGGTFR